MLLVYGGSVSSLGEEKANALMSTYGFDTEEKLADYLKRKGSVFFNLDEWSKFVRAASGVIGTRLHGSIIALNSGRRAVLIPHDSRTAEAASFSGIPIAFGPSIMELNTLEDFRDVVARASLERYKDIRSKNQVSFIRFVEECGLRPKLENMF